jgi:D-psicose/D-tagatose/L-ribulose 3-epimerase
VAGADVLDLACHSAVAGVGSDADALRRFADELAPLGYTRIVLPSFGVDADLGERLVAAVRAAGLAPIAMCRLAPDADVASADRTIGEAGQELLERQVRVAADLGVDHVTGLATGVFGHPSAPAAREQVIAAAQRCGAVAEVAAELGVLLTCEILNRYETSVVTTIADGVAFVQASGSAHLRLHLDTFHMGIEETDPVGAALAALHHVGYVELGQSGRGPLTRGSAPVAALIEALTAAGYTGRWGIEAFSADLLPPTSATALAIWRSTYSDPVALAADAIDLVRTSAARG